MPPRGRGRGVRGRGSGRSGGDMDIPLLPSPLVGIHELIQFADITDVQRAAYQARYMTVRHKKIEIPKTPDWDLLETLQIADQLKGFFSQSYVVNGEVLFTDRVWGNLFGIVEPIYLELCHEFYSTVSFDQNLGMTDFRAPHVLSFRLGGVSRECSLRDFAYRVGLYTMSETRHPQFLHYLDSCAIDTHPDFRRHEFWSQIANGVYNPHSVSDSRIREPVHRILHRLLSFTISHRHSGEKIPVIDLFYMWCMISPFVACNVPYQLARYMANKGIGTVPASPICCGQFITRLAKSWDILIPTFVATLHEEPEMTFMDVRFLRDMGVVTCSRKGVNVQLRPALPYDPMPVGDDEPAGAAESAGDAGATHSDVHAEVLALRAYVESLRAEVGAQLSGMRELVEGMQTVVDTKMSEMQAEIVGLRAEITMLLRRLESGSMPHSQTERVEPSTSRIRRQRG